MDLPPRLHRSSTSAAHARHRLDKTSRASNAHLVTTRTEQMIEHLTYAELAERLGVSSEAARALTKRLRLQRQRGNDGKARVIIDLADVQQDNLRPHGCEGSGRAVRRRTGRAQGSAVVEAVGRGWLPGP